MQTEEIVNRDSNGRVMSTTGEITGMKMALFDVIDVNNPVQLFQTVIGDRRTTSAILTNPKALLFSKKKQLLAIPVNNYNEEFAIQEYGDSYSEIVASYANYSKSYFGEDKINIEDEFKLKGIVTLADKEINSYLIKRVKEQ